MNYRLVLSCTLWLSIVVLSACTSVSRQIQSSLNTQVTNYPAANPINPQLTQAPSVDLSQYKSVEERPNQDKHIAVALAASGGGYSQPI